MSCESKINVPVCHFMIDKHVNSWNKLFIVVTFMKTFCSNNFWYFCIVYILFGKRCDPIQKHVEINKIHAI